MTNEQPSSKDLAATLREIRGLVSQSVVHWSSHAKIAELCLSAEAMCTAHEPIVSLWGDGTREMLIQLRNWLRDRMPCVENDCCKELRQWIARVDGEISNHAPAGVAASPPEAPRKEHRLFDVMVICNAYESGFGHGMADDGLPNPYMQGGDERHAYDLGYDEGKSRRVAATKVVSPKSGDGTGLFRGDPDQLAGFERYLDESTNAGRKQTRMCV